MEKYENGKGENFLPYCPTMCGIVLIFDPERRQNVVPMAEAISGHLHNRGQAAWGITRLGEAGGMQVTHGHKADVHVLHDIAKQRFGYGAIVQWRYPTNGVIGDDMRGAQPFVYPDPDPRCHISIAHNGNLFDHQLRTELRTAGKDADIVSDTDAMGRVLQMRLQEMGGDVQRAVRNVWPMLDGAHSVVGLNRSGDAFAWRDAMEKHPLHKHVTRDGIVVFASEDNAIRQACGQRARCEEIRGGTLQVISQETQTHAMEQARPSRCLVEWWYFAKRLTTIAGITANAVRYRAGEVLARKDAALWQMLNTIPVAIPIPESGKAIVSGYTDKIPGCLRMDAILRDGNAGRTFIESMEQRQSAADRKYSIHPDARQMLKGKHLVVIDDSIVRSTTLTRIRELLQSCEPTDIHYRSAFPPIIAPCVEGIAMPTMEELVMTRYRELFLQGEPLEQIEQLMAQQFGVATLRYLPIAAIPEILDMDPRHVCWGCTRGEYATRSGQQYYEQQLVQLQSAASSPSSHP